MERIGTLGGGPGSPGGDRRWAYERCDEDDCMAETVAHSSSCE